MKNLKQYISRFQNGIVHDTNYNSDDVLGYNGGRGQGSDMKNIMYSCICEYEEGLSLVAFSRILNEGNLELRTL